MSKSLTYRHQTVFNFWLRHNNLLTLNIALNIWLEDSSRLIKLILIWFRLVEVFGLKRTLNSSTHRTVGL